jgi:hypothetical protein
LLRDNAEPHILQTVKDIFTLVKKWEASPHPAYSPGMSPPDSFSSRSIENCCVVNDLSLDTWNAAVTVYQTA